MDYAIFTKPVAAVYGRPCPYRQDGDRRISTISDEALYGSVCRIGEVLDGGWVYQYSAYGYPGYVHADSLKIVSKEEAYEYLSRNLRCIKGRNVDVLTLPTVHGELIIQLPENALVELTGGDTDGWSPIRLADGTEGFVPTSHLKEKCLNEDYLETAPAVLDAMCQTASANNRTAKGGCESFSLQSILDCNFGGSEDAFRSFLVNDALRYMGIQYRWGGRSTRGIDCSGLVSTVYADAGITIFRDASIVDGYAIKRLDVKFEDGKFSLTNLENGAMLPGDAIYFPGHIAMYLGNGKYIHSTAHAGDDGVVINSLVPGEPDFRQDLLDCLYAVGGVRR